MKEISKLPDSEFEVMKAVWECQGTINCSSVLSQMNKDWKAQTVLSLLGRLVERGFLRTEKIGNDRIYFILISEGEYLKFETDNFISQYHDNSFASFFNTLFKGKKLEDSEVQKLRKMLNDNKKR